MVLGSFSWTAPEVVPDVVIRFEDVLRRLCEAHWREVSTVEAENVALKRFLRDAGWENAFSKQSSTGDYEVVGVGSLGASMVTSSFHRSPEKVYMPDEIWMKTAENGKSGANIGSKRSFSRYHTTDGDYSGQRKPIVRRQSAESVYASAGEELTDEEFKQQMRNATKLSIESRRESKLGFESRNYSSSEMPWVSNKPMGHEGSASITEITNHRELVSPESITEVVGVLQDAKSFHSTTTSQTPTRNKTQSQSSPPPGRENSAMSINSFTASSDGYASEKSMQSQRERAITRGSTGGLSSVNGFGDKNLIPGTMPLDDYDNPASHLAEEKSDAKKLNTFAQFSAISAGGSRIYFQCWRNFVSRMRRKVHFAPKDIYAKDDVHWGQLKLIQCGKPESQTETDFSDLLPSSDTSYNAPTSSGSQTFKRYWFVWAPGSPHRIGWDIAGGLLLFFDCVVIPLSAFEPMDSPFSIFMDWVTLLFWTFDMCASCITGYNDKGVTIMSPLLIIKNYLRTWFLLDLFVVIPDWTFTIVELISDVDAGGGGNSSRLLRALRMIRISRMLRLVKLRRILTMIRDRIDSEHLFIMVTVGKLLAMMMVVNHFLAAMWYAIGDFGKSLDAPNWVDQHDFFEKDLGTRYFVSFHWSLTQISPASMDVQPHNVAERIYAIFVLIFGLVLFSSFVSSITTSMTQLRTMEGDKSKQMWLLRRYLRNNGIQAALAWRILRYVEYACNENKNQVSEQKLWVLRLLSNQLRNELNYAVSFSCVRNHPFFEVMSSLSRQTVVRLAINAMSVESLAYNDRLTVPGVVGTRMYMMQLGRLSYVHFTETGLDIDLEHMSSNSLLIQQDWACEGALWTEWYTLGELVAQTECKLIFIEASSFSEVMKDELLVWRLATVYARSFVKWLSEQPYGHLTDVGKAEEMAPLVETFVGQDLLHRHNSFESMASKFSERFSRHSRHSKSSLKSAKKKILRMSSDT